MIGLLYEDRDFFILVGCLGLINVVVARATYGQRNHVIAMCTRTDARKINVIVQSCMRTYIVS